MNAVAVSRAFGNFRHNVINPEPTIAEHELTGDEEYLLIACDGLWDVTNAGQIRSLVDAHMTSNRKSPPGRKWEGVSETLVQGALNSGSGDNVSAIFVPFLCWK